MFSEKLLGWVEMSGRRQTPGRPVTYTTTKAFLDHFNLNTLRDLPEKHELKAVGLMPGKSHDLPTETQPDEGTTE